MRVLIFGDSIGQGQWAATGGWAQRVFLDEVATVVAKPGLVEHVTINLSIGGDTAKSVIKRMAHEIEVRRWEGEATALVFAVGINDAAVWEGESVSSPAEYAQDLREIYKIAKKYTDKILFVGLTPVEDDNSLSSHAYRNARIQQFEEVLRDFTAEKSVPLVPLFEPMQEQMETQTLMVDGLHPNDAGHKLMYEIINPALKKLLQDA